MRVRPVGAGAHDDERNFRMPFGDNRFGDVSGHIGLGAARRQELGHPGVHAVDRSTRLA